MLLLKSFRKLFKEMMFKNDMKRQDKKKILEYYFKLKTKVHLKCLEGIFYNGYIFDLTSEKDLMVFKDDKLGTIPVLFEEIERIEPCKEKENE